MPSLYPEILIIQSGRVLGIFTFANRKMPPGFEANHKDIETQRIGITLKNPPLS
ncbi:hypothetical protein PLAN_100295 [Planktothrix rubescens CCAP 1459/22]|uniref:Uncharacterized protein n=1 Tax=Planktothrix rubescens CCAP 1459/22 TaxID=329571 RepID=A0A6J7ZFZ1_PLARU|nr:hypothetical protein PLAN_100295 [Planktothrix rubescens NIVA-CYA 18]CAD0231276.1 hypothetical protein PL10110_610049 [Planktothrix agardhii]